MYCIFTILIIAIIAICIGNPTDNSIFMIYAHVIAITIFQPKPRKSRSCYPYFHTSSETSTSVSSPPCGMYGMHGLYMRISVIHIHASPCPQNLAMQTTPLCGGCIVAWLLCRSSWFWG
ncbi:uncharacterized protein EV420DRAFT_1545628 [Desarmillaria tabescens]|uniref:Secreted protein n=1 Tax=Armillaria tabescens TaxID=1929756 RepID=A0AA39N5C0_ARMTA|nr:uncharacterized protein EV420DRAFT_1545628 [Desarmillaria tabescens]KAK0457969.1 hypothetical protein EV420DRAFT_1545628 [Desarmillaria tabescens]